MLFPVPSGRGRAAQKSRRETPRRLAGPSVEGPGGGAGIALREDDLDTPVLRFAHTLRSRHPRIVLAATGDDHLVARDA